MLRLPRSIGQTLVPVVGFGAMAVTNLGCETSIAAKYPHLDRRSVCLLVPGIEGDSTQFVFTEDDVPVSNFHPDVVERVAATARTVFEYDPNADPTSPQYLPAPYDQLQCPARVSWLPSGEPQASPLPDASFDLVVHKRPTESKPVPQPIAQQLASCPSAGAGRLGAVRYAMNFNVYLNEKGEAVSAYMKKSTLGDDDTAVCMLEALRKTQWPAPEAASVVAAAPASKLFVADSTSKVPNVNVQDLLKEILRNSTPPEAPGGFKPYYVTIPFGPLIVGATVGVTIFLLPRDTAPACASELNPITRRPYTTLEECEEVKRLSPEEILKRQVAHIKATQPQAPPVPIPQGPTPQPPAEPDCPENERFIPDHTDDARGCFTKKGNLQCYSRRHYPCAGVHTHGTLTSQKMLDGKCVEIKVPDAVRCEGRFMITGPCGSVSTTTCGTEGTATSGVYVKGQLQ